MVSSAMRASVYLPLYRRLTRSFQFAPASCRAFLQLSHRIVIEIWGLSLGNLFIQRLIGKRFFDQFIRFLWPIICRFHHPHNCFLAILGLCFIDIRRVAGRAFRDSANNTASASVRFLHACRNTGGKRLQCRMRRVRNKLYLNSLLISRP